MRTMQQLADLIFKEPDKNHRYTSAEIHEMREWIKRPYSASNLWSHRVDEMKAAQVIAIFKHMCVSGRFKEEVKPVRPHWHQITLYDLSKEIGERMF